MSSRFAEVPIGKVREYWDRRPCNIRHSPAPVGTRQYFDEVEQRKYVVEPHISAFAEFPRWAGKRVLEIGCGAMRTLERRLGWHLCLTARAQ